MRLAVAPDRDLPPGVADEEHENVAKRAFEWQQTACYATLWEMGAATSGADEGRAYALAGQMASAGEQLALAHAGAVEVALWRELRNESDPDAAHEMRMRAMAEAQGMFVLGTGHALANVAVRALALDRNLRAALIERFQRGASVPSFDPFSQNPRDWISLNRDSGKVIQAVARSSSVQEVAELVHPVVGLGTGQIWRKLRARRGEDFHRWRPQTHGIEGVPRMSPWRRERGARVLTGRQSIYEDARGLADETSRVATDAMLQLASSMEVFMERWTLASGHLGGPKFKTA